MAALDEILPVWDVHEVHSVLAPVDPERAVAAALAVPVASDAVVRTLLRLRGLDERGSIEDAFAWLGFGELARREGEVVFGGAGRPWRPGTRIRPFAAAGAGEVRVAADFRADGRTLTTETRVSAMDDDARRAFRRYWLVIGPFSALIRRRWLAAAARELA